MCLEVLSVCATWIEACHRLRALQALLKLSKNTKQDMGSARKLLTAAQEDLESMQETAHLGEGRAPGFLPKINSHRSLIAPRTL